MHVDIITPEEQLFSGESNSIIVPGTDGELGILNDHAPLITSLKKGTVQLRTNDGDKSFDVSSGVVEVLNNKVIILAEK